MPDYEQVETEIFAKEEDDFEPVEEKPKRILSEKQIDALARGRAKVAENREKKRKLLLKKKKDDEFVKQAIEEKIANRMEKRATLKSERENAKREKLLAKKKEEEQRALEAAKPNPKIEQWITEREKALDNCESIEEFDELSGHLDTISEEDILDDKKLHAKLNKIYALYKV
tara:strand:+ start:19 stop:534 length:516 start_codon:yes stop_codon:yes gene_type:complete